MGNVVLNFTSVTELSQSEFLQRTTLPIMPSCYVLRRGGACRVCERYRREDGGI